MVSLPRKVGLWRVNSQLLLFLFLDFPACCFIEGLIPSLSVSCFSHLEVGERARYYKGRVRLRRRCTGSRMPTRDIVVRFEGKEEEEADESPRESREIAIRAKSL
ncbi:hypothetical protein GE09DRAFT_1112555 [Coniochaeta sp. 2T2.1]|nr:hypothetical protein GE09DRAFT_1112555 [Coniochaeta sp. 2T2.1]